MQLSYGCMSLSIILIPNYGLEFLYLSFLLSQQKMGQLKCWWGGWGFFFPLLQLTREWKFQVQYNIQSSSSFFLSQYLGITTMFSARLFFSFGSCLHVLLMEEENKRKMSYKALFIMAIWDFLWVEGGIKFSSHPKWFQLS